MTNAQIIIKGLIENGIYTKEQIEELISNGHSFDIHTMIEWRRMGYSIKKGEHAKMKLLIWHPKKKNAKNYPPVEAKENEEVDETRFYKAPAFFFGKEQVEERNPSWANIQY